MGRWTSGTNQLIRLFRRILFFRYRTATVDFTKPPSELEQLVRYAAADDNISLRETTENDADFEGTWGRWPLRSRFEWYITGGDSTTVTEQLEISTVWLVAFYVAVAMGGFAFMSQHRLLMLVGSLCIFALYAWAHVFYPNPLASLAVGQRGYKTNQYAVQQILAAAAILGALIFYISPVPINFLGSTEMEPSIDTWVLAYFGTVIVSALLIGHIEESGEESKKFPYDIVDRVDIPVPELSGGYLSFVVIVSLPMIIFTNSSFLFVFFHHFYSSFLVVYFYYPVLLADIAILSFLYWSVYKNRSYIHMTILDRLEEQLHPVRKGIAIFIMVAASYAMAGLFVTYWLTFEPYFIGPLVNLNILALRENALMILVLIPTAIPISYFFLGVLYQITAFSVDFIEMFRRSTPRTLELDYSFDAQIRAVDSNRYDAMSCTVGFRDYIFVSTALLEETQPEELAAVLAHEEGHIKHRDALLSLLIPIFGTLGLTGKNLLYAVVNFQRREFRADDYAQEKVSPAALDQALATIAGRQFTLDENYVHTGTNFVPFSGQFDIDTYIERIFGLFFGDFALSRAHPDIDDRRARLQSKDG